jgi:hypothetical protein
MKTRIDRWLIQSVAILAFTAATLHVLALTNTWARAETPLPEGKTVRILVGFPPGGSHDLEARVLARHVGKYLPGNPSIIVQNMPGAGADIMISHLARRVKPDGTTVGIAASTQKLAPPAGREVAYDLSKMPVFWATRSASVHVVSKTLAKTARDLIRADAAKIIVAGRTALDQACTNGRLALDLLGIKGYTPVCRYPGIAPVAAAIERDEVSYFVAVDSHLMAGGAFADLAARGVVVPIWQAGIIAPDGKITRSPTLPEHVPTLYEVYRDVHGKPPSGAMWDAALAIGPNLDSVIRSYHLPPGTETRHVRLWREAIERVVKDPAFVALWERTFGQELAPALVRAEQADQIITGYFEPAPWHEFFKKFIAELDR